MATHIHRVISACWFFKKYLSICLLTVSDFRSCIGVNYRLKKFRISLKTYPGLLFGTKHVYNSLGAHFAVFRNEKLQRKPVVHIGSLVLCVSIILSTMFLKQHSVFDVLTAFIMAAVMYIVVYGFDIVTIWQNHRYGVRRRRIRQV